MNGEIKSERVDSIVTITISRPEKLNSVTKEMLDDFATKISRFTNDPEIGGIIITGEGEKAFSAGFDLDMIKGLGKDEKVDFFKRLEKIMRVLRHARHCITLAAVNGYAIGFGAMVAEACDFRFFAENAAFRLPEIDVGVFPGAGASSNLVHLVGPARAKDILITGRAVPAEECLRIGLACRVLPLDDLMPTAKEFLEGLVKKDRGLLLRTKSLVDSMTGLNVEEADEMESTYLDEWLSEL